MVREIVTAIPMRPPRFGLIAAAPLLDTPDQVWGTGFRFLPEQPAGTGRAAVFPDTGLTDPITPTQYRTIVNDDAFVVWAGESMSTFGWKARDWEARAMRALNATRSYEMAAELWGPDTLGLAQRRLDDTASDRLTAAAVTIVKAVACIEAGLANCLRGGQGMIHVPTWVLTSMVADFQLARLDGSTYMSPNGHIIVPDAGYPGTGPGDESDGNSSWIYGTSMIGVRQGPVETVPGSLDDAKSLAAAMGRDVNDLTAWAQQVVAWQWDEVCHVAAQTDIAPCLIGGAS